MAGSHRPRGWDSRERERRGVKEDKQRGGPDDSAAKRDSPQLQRAHGHYSGSEQAEERSKREGVTGARYKHGEGSHGAGMDHENASGQDRRDQRR